MLSRIRTPETFGFDNNRDFDNVSVLCTFCNKPEAGIAMFAAGQLRGQAVQYDMAGNINIFYHLVADATVFDFI